MKAEELIQELSDQDRVMLVFGYLGPLALVPLIASRREFVKWHAKQGLVLMTALAVLYFGVLKPLALLFDRYIWGFFAELFWAVIWLVVLGVLVIMLVCIVRGLEGERFKIPLLGDLVDRL
jgi:uncharacterized membrane protein